MRNIDTQILELALSLRLKQFLPNIIHSNPKMIHHIYIGFTSRQMQDIIDHSEKYTIDGVSFF